LPDFEEQTRRLAELDVKFRTFEDHHPYTAEQLEMLQRLNDEGLIRTLRMSGPLQGDEQAEEEQKCAAEMVYERLIRDTAWDNPAMAELRDAAHSEDLVQQRGPLGRSLTELIKGGINKVELAQQLSQCEAAGGVADLLERQGWRERVEEARKGFEEATPRLWDNVVLAKFRRDPNQPAGQGGPAISPGSDVVDPKAGDERRETFSVLMVHAPFPKPGGVKINVGKATEFFAEQVPEADYLFYCYGSRLLVARRLNQADLALNLGALMPLIGGPGDGGHAGAAVCRPESNEAFPKEMLSNVRGGAFRAFTRYLSERIEQASGHAATGRSNLSKPVEDARAYAERFTALGWEVTLLTDPAFSDFAIGFGDFVDSLTSRDEVVFVFSGHGWSAGAENYLTFTDTPFDPGKQVTRSLSAGLTRDVLVPLQRLDREETDRPKIIVAIVDACRERPFPETATMSLPASSMGLVPIEPAEGMIIIQSARFGQFAWESLGETDTSPHSAFNRFMLAALKDPARPLHSLAFDVRDAVKAEAAKFNKRQAPAVYAEISRDYCLQAPCRSASQARSPEAMAWAQAQAADTIEAYRGYIALFGDDAPNAGQARAEIVKRTPSVRDLLNADLWRFRLATEGSADRCRRDLRQHAGDAVFRV